MPINYNEILECEARAMASGLMGPYVRHVAQSDVDALADEFQGTPMAEKVKHPDGFMFSNTRIIGCANPS